ncbi:MAG: DHH family phosphoesterase [Nanoarchaeota archaeon]|nr:DHH family phosphoesterase [Nanoarchaeota archaeon]
MLTDDQIKEIRSYIENSKNPLFLFDDDPDGLTAYLLLKKHYKKGVGVCVKASPNSGIVYSAAVSRHKPDLAVILDKPILDQEIIDEMNVPIVWIDHHQPVKREGVRYYNPMNGEKPDNRCTSYWAYRVVEDNEWVAVVGIIGDWQMPEKSILKKFEYADKLGDGTTPPELMFNSEYGKMVKIFSFAMKGTTESTNECIEVLEKINDPMEILEQTTPNGRLIYEKFKNNNKDYELLLGDALSQKIDGNVFVYTYPGIDRSFTGMLANELLHKIPHEVIILGREKDGDVRMSLRSRDRPILPVLKKILEVINGHGGGHAQACGASVKMEDFPKFVEMISKEFS